MKEEAKQAIDVAAGGVTLSAYLSWIPEATAIASLIWVLLRIYETETVQKLIKKNKQEADALEPVTTLLTGLALAKEGINFIKSNLDTIDDAKAIGESLINIFEGHQEFNRKRFKGGLKDVAIEMIEYQQQQETLYELKMMLDLRFHNGFYDEIQAEYKKRLREQKEIDRQNQIRRRKRAEKILLLSLLFAAFGIVAVIIYIVMAQINR